MNIQNIEHKLNTADYPPDIVKSCYKYSIKLLAHKDYSKYKLANKLLDRDYPHSLVADLIELLVQEKYLREDYYKEARIKGLMNKGYHPQVIKHKMQQEQCPVSDEEIDEVLSEYELTDYQMLKDLVIKKLRIIDSIGKVNEEKKWDKVIRFISSKGHCPNMARSILRELSH